MVMAGATKISRDLRCERLQMIPLLTYGTVRCHVGNCNQQCLLLQT